MAQFAYETHLHTRFGSRCGRAAGKDYISKYIDLGYSGIFVTDHFFHGNCAVDQTLPWRDQVDWYCRGYEDALEEGIRQGLDVFFGWEQNFAGDEYLVYGLDKAWLYEHPEVKDWTRREQAEQVHAYGGCVIQAHPFRDRDYIRAIHLNPYFVDGVEIYNAQNPIYVNALGYRYGKKLGLPMTCGSDIHTVDDWSPDHIAGIASDTRILDEKDFAARILSGKCPDLLAPLDKLDQAENPQIFLRADIGLEVVDRDGISKPYPIFG